MEAKRTLYQCSEARVRDSEIYCHAGRILDRKSKSGTIHIRRLTNGNPLGSEVCQKCPYFSYMGEPVPKEDRGWNNIKGGIK